MIQARSPSQKDLMHLLQGQESMFLDGLKGIFACIEICFASMRHRDHGTANAERNRIAQCEW